MKPIVLPFCLLLASVALAQAPTSKLLSLQQLCGARPLPRLPQWSTLLDAATPGSEEGNVDLLGIADGGNQARFEVGTVHDLLTELNLQAIDDNKLHLEATGLALHAVGDAAAVAKVQAQLRFASEVIARPVEIEFAAWDATDRETPPAVMSAADFQRFATNRMQLWRSNTATSVGAPATLGRERWTRYVKAVNVEVAQKQNISNPVMATFGEGGRAVVLPLPLLGDEFVLQAQFLTGQRRGVVRSVACGVPGAPDIELPTLETGYGACSARVANGGAMAVTLRGNAAGGGQVVLTFRVTAKQPPASNVQDGVAVLPCGALTAGGLRQRHAVPSPCRSDTAQDALDEDQYGRIDGQQLQVLLAASHLEQLETNGGFLRVGGGFVFVKCDAPTLARIENTLRALQDEVVRNVTISQLGTLTAADGKADASPLLHELAMPSLLGREAIVARLLEMPFLRSIECEIAQEASTLSPFVDTLQTGTWLRLRAAPDGETMQLDLDLQCAHAPLPTSRPVMPGGIVMPTEVQTATVIGNTRVGNGQALDQGDGPTLTIDGRTCRSTLTTTLRW
ncbi:MAG: hypothetical protein IT455_10180 [Planctomycetes bacterium]|nr:hypothetical protein [Planctomycetota bacterium]